MGCVGGVSVSHHKGVCSGGRTGKGRSDSMSPQLKAGAKKQELESGDDLRSGWWGRGSD